VCQVEQRSPLVQRWIREFVVFTPRVRFLLLARIVVLKLEIAMASKNFARWTVLGSALISLGIVASAGCSGPANPHGGTGGTGGTPASPACDGKACGERCVSDPPSSIPSFCDAAKRCQPMATPPACSPCAPQDAVTPTSGNCEGAFRYRWDGYSCTLVNFCSCSGSDCDELYTSKETCLSAHAQCPSYDCSGNPTGKVAALLAQNASCASDADCTTLPPLVCFGACNVPVNKSVDPVQYAYLSRQQRYCENGDSGTVGGCLVGCPVQPTAVCTNGVCTAKVSSP
jgi:hypothetical protein